MTASIKINNLTSEKKQRPQQADRQTDMKTKETTFTKTNRSKNLPPTIKSIVNALNKIKKKKKQGQERQKNNKKKSQTYVSTYQMIFK